MKNTHLQFSDRALRRMSEPYPALAVVPWWKPLVAFLVDLVERYHSA